MRLTMFLILIIPFFSSAQNNIDELFLDSNYVRSIELREFVNKDAVICELLDSICQLKGDSYLNGSSRVKLVTYSKNSVFYEVDEHTIDIGGYLTFDTKYRTDDLLLYNYAIGYYNLNGEPIFIALKDPESLGFSPTGFTKEFTVLNVVKIYQEMDFYTVNELIKILDRIEFGIIDNGYVLVGYVGYRFR